MIEGHATIKELKKELEKDVSFCTERVCTLKIDEHERFYYIGQRDLAMSYIRKLDKLLGGGKDE